MLSDYDCHHMSGKSICGGDVFVTGPAMYPSLGVAGGVRRRLAHVSRPAPARGTGARSTRPVQTSGLAEVDALNARCHCP